MVWPQSPTKHVVAAKADIIIIWWDSQHNIVFEQSIISRDMFIINKACISLTHSNLTRSQSLTEWRWKFSNWEMDDPCSWFDMNITFKERRFMKLISLQGNFSTWCNLFRGIKMYYVKVETHQHQLTGRSDMRMPFCDQGENSTCLVIKVIT